MERLTKTWNNNCVSTKIDYAELSEFGNDTFNEIIKLIQKVGEIEDLEEQDRLMILPCKIGDTIYEIFYVHKCTICPLCKEDDCKSGVKGFKCPESRSTIRETEFNLNCYSIHTQSLVHNLFLTQEEAEKALEEQHGK